MKALVIYDTTGRIWNIVYGQEEVPQGLTCMWVDIPDGGVLERIDVTDPENPQPVFSYLPESDIGRLQKDMDTVKEKTEELNSIVNPTINAKTCTLEELKAWQINLSKNMLVAYLEEHPLVTNCHRNKVGTYTITEDKRNLFTSKYTAHVALVAAGIEDQMTWNESGQACEPWTDEECIQFIAQWNAISTPLVAYQQEYELSVQNCETKDAILLLGLDYSLADPRNTTADDVTKSAPTTVNEE